MPERHLHDGQSGSEPDPADVYRDLPPDLIATLRDPRVLLPGELDVFEHVYRWVEASPHPGASVYINAQGNTIPARSDT